MQDDKDFLTTFNIKYPYRRPRAQWNRSINENKILVRSDPHCPYQSVKVSEALMTHKDAHVLIVTGDEGDFYSKSRYRKQRYVSFRDEVRSVFYDIEWMATHWRRVLIMPGNHDDRPAKRIQESIPVDMLALAELNLLKRLVSFFDNVQIVGHTVSGTGLNLTHIYQHGDIVFTHGELTRVQKTATLEHISKYLYQRKGLLGLKSYRVIAQSHNHDALKTQMGDEYWFLLPTASDPYSLGMEYIWNARMWGKPPVVGFSIFYQYNGETDFNESDNVIIS